MKTKLQRVMEAHAGAGDPEILDELRRPDSEARRIADELHRLAAKKIDLSQIPGLDESVQFEQGQITLLETPEAENDQPTSRATSEDNHGKQTIVQFVDASWQKLADLVGDMLGRYCQLLQEKRYEQALKVADQARQLAESLGKGHRMHVLALECVREAAMAVIQLTRIPVGVTDGATPSIGDPNELPTGEWHPGVPDPDDQSSMSMTFIDSGERTKNSFEKRAPEPQKDMSLTESVADYRPPLNTTVDIPATVRKDSSQGTTSQPKPPPGKLTKWMLPVLVAGLRWFWEWSGVILPVVGVSGMFLALFISSHLFTRQAAFLKDQQQATQEAYLGTKADLLAMRGELQSTREASTNAMAELRAKVELDRTGVSAGALTLMAHTDSVTTVTFAPDGNTFASGSLDGTARIWNITKEKTESRLMPVSKPVLNVRFGPDDRLLIGDSSKTVVVCNTRTGQEVSRIDRDDHATTMELLPAAPLFASGGTRGSVQLWNQARKIVLSLREFPPAYLPPSNDPESKFDTKHWELTPHKGETFVALSPNGKILASTGQSDGAIHTWNSDTGKKIGKFETKLTKGMPPRDLVVKAITFSPNNELIAVGKGLPKGADMTDKKGEVEVWDLRNSRLLARIPGFYASVTTVAFAPSSSYIAVGCSDGEVWIYDFHDRAERFYLRSHRAPVLSLAFSPNAKQLATGGEDGIVRIWNVWHPVPAPPPYIPTPTQKTSLAPPPYIPTPTQQCSAAPPPYYIPPPTQQCSVAPPPYIPTPNR